MKTSKKFVAVVLALIMCFSCFTLITSAEETGTIEHLTEVPEGYVGIYTKDDLDNIKLNMTGKYILMNDIVFEDSDYEKGGSFYNSGKGWEPIGTSSTKFNGVFDGNGYKINNLYINNPEQDYVGLFGYGHYSTIKNVTLENANITGKNYTGGIIGYASLSNILSSSMYGQVNGVDYTGGICGCLEYTCKITFAIVYGNVTGRYYVGGICGYQKNVSQQKNISEISLSINSATVTGKYIIGGIVGGGNTFQNMINVAGVGKINIDKCINTGKISADEHSAGGIIGSASVNTSTYTVYINNCFNVGDVISNNGAGGVLGGGCYTLKNITNSYSIGSIVSEKGCGGISGYEIASANFCYYLDEFVINPTCTSGIAKSEDQMRKQTTYEQWDFNTVWTMSGREDYPYPELKDVPLIFPEDSIPHEHTYTSEITKEATHLEEGVITYTCECGNTYTEVIEKITEHNYETITILPTCTNQGYTIYTCECGESYIDNYVDAIGHDFADWIVKIESDCTTRGEEYRNCNKCGKKEYQYTDALGHNFESAITPPTCTKYGYTTYTCICGESYTCDYTNATGHNYTSEITTPATHTTTGVMIFTCTCGDTYTETIAKTAEHTYNAIVTASTCTEQGYTTYTCECGDSYVDDYVDATGHTPANAVEENYVAPTCTEKGSKDIVVYCSVCEEEINRETVILNAIGHADNDDDGYCDADNELLDPSVECDHNCHKGGFFWKLTLFFNKLFRTNKYCACGVAHY